MLGTCGLGSDFAWTDHCSVSYQLLGKGNDYWYLSGKTAHQFDSVCSATRAGSQAIWSPDGCRLFLNNHLDRIIELEFQAEQLSPIGEIDRTPPDWDSGFMALVSGTFSSCGRDLYCLIPRPDYARGCVLRFTAKPFFHSVLSDISCFHKRITLTKQEPVILHFSELDPGLLSITSLTTLNQKSYRLSEKRLGATSLSHSGRYCAYATGCMNPEGTFFVFDLETGKSRKLCSASFGTWSPDDTYIAAVRANQEFLLIHHDSGEVTSALSLKDQVKEDRLPGLDGAVPQWSPDGQQVVFGLTQWEPLPEGMSNQTLIVDGKQRHIPRVVGSHDFVLDIRTKQIFPLPFPISPWSWRPSRIPD